MKKFNVIDLFCGAGGLSEGFRLAGFNVVMGVDSVEVFTKTFSKNNPKAKAICGDIRKLTAEEIKKKLKNKKITVIVGGPPCQGFSMAGERDPKDPRNSLFMEFLRIVEGIKPDYFIMENVPGLLTMTTASGENVSEIIEREFKRIGYAVHHKILLAADYGVPQKRKRVIFIGTNTGRSAVFPLPTNSKVPHKRLDGTVVGQWIPVSSVLLKENEVPKNFFHSERMILGFKRRRENNKKNGKGFGWQILNLEEPSYTLSARYWKDGSDALVKYTDKKIRMLTPEECAAIQTFPKDYKFIGSKREVYTQIGNAVPPLLAKALAEAIKKNL